MSTLTDNLSLTKPAAGSSGWADDVNTNFDVIDARVGHVYDVLQYGLIDDNLTDNSAALTALIALVPTTLIGRHATFLWPKNDTGWYRFGSTVAFGNRSIRNIGASGSIASHDTRQMICCLPMANDSTVFTASQTGTVGFDGPSFENMSFNSESHVPNAGFFTGCTGVSSSGVNRLGFRRCVFFHLATGLKFDYGGLDSAWHHLQNLIFYSCDTGLQAVSTNSWQLFGASAVSCGIGIDISGGSSIQMYGIKINTGATDAIGVRINGYGTAIYGLGFESGAFAGPRTGIQINGIGTSTSGNGNLLHGLFLHGGGVGSNANIGVDITSGANDNQVNVLWSSAFGSQANVVKDAGLRNRVNGSIVTKAGIPSDSDFPYVPPSGTMALDTTNSKLYVRVGSTWKSVTVA